jgi:pimeloyl-ACP methyl ester carboxylesterase
MQHRVEGRQGWKAAAGPPPIGRLHEIGGRRLALHRSGTGRPALVVAPGAGLVGLDYLNIHDPVAEFATSVLYDRAGTGWSDEVELPRTATAVTDELRSLLRAAGVPAPYLLVGHSLGGAYVRRFAQRFPDEVAGLLLLEPAHEDYPAHMPDRVREAGEQVRNAPVPEPTGEQLQFIRGLFAQMLAAWPDSVRDPLIEYHLAAWRVGLQEGRNMDEVFDELRHGGAVPEVPTIVLTAMGVDPGARLFMPDELLREQNDAKRDLYAAFAASLPRGEHRVLEDAAHSSIHIDRPDAVLAAIRDLLDRVEGIDQDRSQIER